MTVIVSFVVVVIILSKESKSRKPNITVKKSRFRKKSEIQ